MDRSDLQAMIRFAYQNGIMDKPFTMVFKWYNIANSITHKEYTLNYV